MYSIEVVSQGGAHVVRVGYAESAERARELASMFWIAELVQVAPSDHAPIVQLVRNAALSDCEYEGVDNPTDARILAYMREHVHYMLRSGAALLPEGMSTLLVGEVVA